MKLTPRRRMAAPSLGGLLASRQGSLLLALLCAIVAGILVLAALSRVKTNVARPVPQATALVATGEIQKGTTGAQIVAHHLYKSTPVASDQLSAGAISDASALNNVTALSNVLPGQQLTTSDFGTVVGVDQTLHGNQRAMEIDISGASGATNITQAGDRVDIWNKVGGAAGHSLLIAPDVLVLKPATATPVTIGNQSVPGTSLVVRVPDAVVSTLVGDASTIYVVLRPGKGSTGASLSTPAPTSTTGTSTTTGATP